MNVWITAIIPSSGSVAMRVAKPTAKRTEKISSLKVARRAAHTGSSNGTLYSSSNSLIANSHELILSSPELKNTAPIAIRMASWMIESGNRASHMRAESNQLRTVETYSTAWPAALMVRFLERMVSSRSRVRCA
jgi:hypothetical protein